MKGLVVLVVIAALTFASLPARVEGNGWTCFYCTIITNTLFEYTLTHGNDMGQALEQVCYLFPQEYQRTCEDIVFVAGPIILNYYVAGSTPDEVCINGLRICDKPECVLFPRNNASSSASARVSREEGVRDQLLALFDKLARTPRRSVRADPVVDHLPLVDDDGDRFSTFATLRGTSWRGKDCDDHDPNVYPGRKAAPSGKESADYNCNGINGVDPTSGRPWKDLLCANSQQMGAVIFGDSAAAHFSIKPEWLEGQYINSTTYSDLVFGATNELDWPHKSWVTGHVEDPFVDSLYLRLRKQNLCNHRDYQNVAVNGANSLKLKSIVPTVARNDSFDQPVLAVYANIGNDICSQRPNLDHMTSVADFTSNVISTLKYLDSGVLPAGSHLLLVGLVDGRFLWDTLHARMNPIGRPYEDVYSWLACIGINPCWQWLNPNATIRNAASTRAAQLSDVLLQISKNSTFKHFDTAYTPFPLAQIAQQWEQRGGQAADLIEPIDGFHPSQIGHYLIAGDVWNGLLQSRPDWIPAPNPNNARIAQLFGAQGGY